MVRSRLRNNGHGSGEEGDGPFRKTVPGRKRAGGGTLLRNDSRLGQGHATVRATLDAIWRRSRIWIAAGEKPGQLGQSTSRTGNASATEAKSVGSGTCGTRRTGGRGCTGFTWQPSRAIDRGQ